MKIVIVSGSSRAESQSLKVSNWLSSQLEKLSVEGEVLDLHQYVLPDHFEDIWSQVMGEPALKLQEILEPADGYIIVAPEWNGMIPGALQNFFAFVGKSMADKPALIVSVSATPVGGAYPIAGLRINTHKNTRINYIPEQLRVTEVNKHMNSEDSSEYIEQRAIYDLKVLIEYAKALEPVRKSGVIDYKTYEHGM